MRKLSKLTEKTCFIIAFTFTAFSVLCAFLTLISYCVSMDSGLDGISGLVAFFALSAAKLAVTYFMSAVTFFLSFIAIVFAVRTIIKNEKTVKKYGIILTVISSETALASLTAFTVISVYLANFKV